MDKLLAINNLPIAVIWLVAGFILLVKGADFFVDGSSSVAKMLKVPSLIIGLTIVAMGTSLPECAVSVTAALAKNNELAIANAVGSNLFNLMVVCGVCAVLCPLAVQKSTLMKEYPFSVGVAALLLVFGLLGMQVGHLEG
ncbi:MAG: sodium:calcium antiporter, partial [Oscillospiraceae bacterium]|nr:sodium:calcium antiporter [Oscillospiraceae bacterium]